MDIYKANPNDLAAKAKSGEVFQDPGQDTDQHQWRRQRPVWAKRLFYDSAEGLLTAMFLLVAEYLPTEDEDGNPVEKRHIVSVFKLVQELLAPSKG